MICIKIHNSIVNEVHCGAATDTVVAIVAVLIMLKRAKHSTSNAPFLQLNILPVCTHPSLHQTTPIVYLDKKLMG